MARKHKKPKRMATIRRVAERLLAFGIIVGSLLGIGQGVLTLWPIILAYVLGR